MSRIHSVCVLKMFVKYVIKTVIQKSLHGHLSILNNMGVNSWLSEAVNRNKNPGLNDPVSQTPTKPKV